MSKRHFTLMAALLVVSACGDGASSDDSVTESSEVVTTTAAATTTAPTTTTTEAAVVVGVALCDAYLQFRGAQDVDTMVTGLEGMRDALGSGSELGGALSPEVIAAMDAFNTGDFDSVGGVGAAIGTIRDLVFPPCEQRFYEGVTGAGDIETVSQLFVDALASGDREAAATLAQAEVIAINEPWAPLGDEVALLDVGADEFGVRLSADDAITCEVSNGVIDRCHR